MMPTSAPPYRPPTSQDRQLASVPSDRNAAAITSLVCAILWPMCLAVTLLWTVVTHSAAQPDWIATLVGFGLTVLPPLGIVTAVVGFLRSFTRRQLRGSRWQAIVGLIFCLMWLGGIVVL